MKPVDDPIANKTSWKPLKLGGVEYRSHAIKLEDEDTIIFAPMRCVFTHHLALVIVAMVLAVLTYVFAPPKVAWVLYAVGSYLFLTATVGLLRRVYSVTFEKPRGVAWRKLLGMRTMLCRLDRIYAIQVISERFEKQPQNQGHDQSFRSYELNLVLEDAKRINIMDHGHQKELIKEAKMLARFLDVPWWNGT